MHIYEMSSKETNTASVRLSPMTSMHDGKSILEFNTDEKCIRLVCENADLVALLAAVTSAIQQQFKS